MYYLIDCHAPVSYPGICNIRSKIYASIASGLATPSPTAGRGGPPTGTTGRLESLVRAFRRKLPTSSCNHGEQRPTSHTTHCSVGGVAGAVKEGMIRFQAL